VPWRGPAEPGEFPTLGYQVGEWIEAEVVIPDGYRRGEPYLLTDEMWRFLLWFYRLDPESRTPYDALVHFGGQLRRSQKWGKDPFGAAIILAEAMGPARFDGWDAHGEPVGAPYPTPYIPCLGVSEEQTDNTYKPLVAMIREGPLIDRPGMDAGDTRVELPGGGTIEPVTSSPKSRLGQRMTFATLTETHLWTPPTGRKLAAAVKRNIAGMDGRWLELTNAWDPSEDSEAQATAEGKEPGVHVDTVTPQRVDDLTNDDALRAELLRQYGDSARQRGGWVNVERIMLEVRSPRVTEADARRFFLNEVVMGEHDFVDPTIWDSLAETGAPLAPKQRIALGFDGSRSDDATALVAYRLTDRRLFELGIWKRSRTDPPEWRVPRDEVDARVTAAFEAYDVRMLWGDPYKWESYFDVWAGRWPKRVYEEPTNSEKRFDADIRLFLQGIKDGSLSHDGSELLTRHIKNAAIAKGNRRAAHDTDEGDALSRYYLRVVKKRTGKIDGAVAAVLAVAAGGYAIEHGALTDDAPFFAASRR
jgi:hypothetical protein